MQVQKHTFSKAERLCGEIRINTHFDKGDFFLSYPFRIGFSVAEKGEIPVQVLIGVPKKRFKHAVDRNRIKRLIREVYRLNKAALYALLENKTIYLSVNYVANEIFPYETMQQKWQESIEKLSRKLQ
ncbi:MAG: ribonuclease P protein component [Prevotellaceae bacterium]|jgi:ribonuclease P protein component|nr:ribonuclease P protein component [Prevotellaceae bacterium]